MCCPLPLHVAPLTNADVDYALRVRTKYGIVLPFAPEEDPLMLTGPSECSMATKAGMVRDE